MKKQIILPLFGAAILLTVASCNNNNNQEKTTTDMSAHADHEHTYRCPMHPEVTGKEGDKCPKCGMTLQHMDEASGGSAEYFMQSGDLSAATAGKEIVIALTPKKKGSENEAVALDVEHDKKIHLIAVSEDLAWFDHIHPEYQPDGSYTVKETFPAGGKYLLFADYKPTDGQHKVDKIEVQVQGTPAVQKTYATDRLSGNTGAFSFILKPNGGKFISGAPMHIEGIVSKDGKEIDAGKLENYLGAKAHVVVVGVADKDYLHVHPEVQNGRFDMHTTFDKPGVYRWWVQFQDGGKVQTIDFVTTVHQGTPEEIKAASQGHPGGEEAHGAHGGHEGH